MAPLFGMNHALFEIKQLRRRDLNALDADRRTMAVWPQIAGENVAEKIPLHDLVVLESRRKTVLTLELRIGLRVIPTRIDGVGLANITPAVACLRSDMLGEKITPLGIHLEVRAGIASGANGGFQLVTAAMTEPAGQTLALLVVFGLALHRITLLAELFQLCADGIILAVGDFFSDAFDIRHDKPPEGFLFR